MLDDHELVNKKTYEDKQTVLEYSSTEELFKPEESIFEKYKESMLGNRWLDVGCGAGRTSAFLMKNCSEYTGIDYSSAMIEFCKKRFNHGRFLQADVRTMDVFEDVEFDFVLFSFNGIDYLSHEGRLQGLKEIHRVLAEHGVFVFSTHNRLFFEKQWGGVVPSPKLRFTLNPLRQLQECYTYFTCMRNYLKNKKRWKFEDTYCIVNGVSHNYGLLTYWIDLRNQVVQLRQCGFDVVDLFDTNGNVLSLSDRESQTPWIHYVAKKSHLG